MARMSHTFATMKIRVAHSARGQAYCHISLPTEAMRKLNWHPHEFKMVYANEDGEMVICDPGKPMKNLIPDDHPPMSLDALNIPRKESIMDIALRHEREAEEMIAKITQSQKERAERKRANAGQEARELKEKLRVRDEIERKREAKAEKALQSQKALEAGKHHETRKEVKKLLSLQQKVKNSRSSRS